MSSTPLDHILRAALPWRDDQPLTECGRDPGKVAQTITRTELGQRLRQWGQQRTVFTVCMTCYQRSNPDHPGDGWERDPISVLYREMDRVVPWAPSGHDEGSPDRVRLTHELRALAALAEAHRDEFTAYLDGLDNAIPLSSKRQPPQKWTAAPRGR